MTIPDALRADLDRGAQAAQAGYQQLRDFLADELIGQAPEADAIGAQRYPVLSRQFLGATVDLAETYAWGLDEVARIEGLMDQTADEIKSGATVAEAIDILDADPVRKLRGTEQLQAWMQERSDAADRGPGRQPLRDLRAAAPAGVPDRAHPHRRHLLLRSLRRLLPARAGCGGRCRPASPSSPPGAS